MCGRYFLDEEIDEIKAIIKEVERKHKEAATGEVYPSNQVALLTKDESSDEIEYDAMPWGFKGFKGSQLIINARSETVTEKKMFAAAFKKDRCVFPTTGFYEWSPEKEKFLFRQNGSEVLYLAGFYKPFDNENRSIILTTAANASVEKIHNRMPVILEKQLIDQWLSDEEFAEDYLKEKMPTLVSQSV